MNSKELSQIRSKLKDYLKDRNILDIVIFGSIAKGKAAPNDIDIAMIANGDVKADIEGFHVSILKPKDFFIEPPMLVNTLLREGFSLKHNMPFSEIYKFLNRVLFVYELKGLLPASKVKIVSALRGKAGGSGLVKENDGEWLANGAFIAPVESAHVFERFFLNFEVKFKKRFVLMH